jgi:cytoskeletal protein RodZ
MLTTKLNSKLDQKGHFNVLIIPLVVVGLLLITTAVLSVMYYGKFTEQRDKNQPLINAAVTEATNTQKTKLETEFTAREKEPYKNYTTPSELGSVKLTFPKTWSSYVISKGSSLDYYGHPNYVPSTGVNYALRMNILTSDFSNAIKSYDAAVQKGTLKATAVRVSGVTGTRLDGFLKPDQQGSMVIFPLRDKVLKIWTESNDYKADFDNVVVKNLTFVP